MKPNININLSYAATYNEIALLEDVENEYTGYSLASERLQTIAFNDVDFCLKIRKLRKTKSILINSLGCMETPPTTIQFFEPFLTVPNSAVRIKDNMLIPK